MGTQVKWGTLNFNVTGKITRGVTGFTASIAKKGKDSESKKEFTEAEEVSFTITSSLVAGGNPLKDYTLLKSFIAYNSKAKKEKKRGYKLQVNDGNKKKLIGWRGGKFELTNVTLNNTKMDAFGRILAAEIGLKFKEIPTKSAGKKKTIKNYQKKFKLKGTW